jgi:hypothetical protein
VWGIFVIAAAGLLISRAGQLSSWVSLRWVPLLSLLGSFFVSMLLSWASPALLSWLDIQQHFAEIASAHGFVSGPELLITLLAISTLTESAGFAYLCLPSDRAEMRLAAITKSALLTAFIEPIVYEEWYRQLPEPDRTPLRKLLIGLMSPRDGLGGWYILTPADFDEAIGKDMWVRFSRYVDTHLDDGWVRICMVALATGIVMGLACLFYRYFGQNAFTFHPTEFGIIFLLVLLNMNVGAIFVSLAFGLHQGELSIVSAIKRAVNEVRPQLAKRDKDRARNDLGRLRRKVK